MVIAPGGRVVRMAQRESMPELMRRRACGELFDRVVDTAERRLVPGQDVVVSPIHAVEVRYARIAVADEPEIESIVARIFVCHDFDFETHGRLAAPDEVQFGKNRA